jgi:hypothetical protein
MEDGRRVSQRVEPETGRERAGDRLTRYSGTSFPVLPKCWFSRTLKGMDVHLTNPDLQAKLDLWVKETGRGPDDLVEDAMAGYFDELARTREMLNDRYDALKSGRVKSISRDELVAHFREKSAAARRTQSGE